MASWGQAPGDCLILLILDMWILTGLVGLDPASLWASKVAVSYNPGRKLNLYQLRNTTVWMR